MARSKKKIKKENAKKTSTSKKAKKPKVKAKAAGAKATKSAKSKASTKPAKKSAPKPAKTAIGKSAAKPAKGKVSPAKASIKFPVSKKSVDWASFFTPLDDRILLEAAPALEKTAGGLYIPDTVKERPNQGKVVAVGPGGRDKKGRLKPLDVQPGDSVMYGEYAGTKIELAGKDVILLRETDILAIIS